MKNYLICYYILQQCLFETLEDDIADLLSKMSPESTDDGTPSDPKTFQRWVKVIDADNMTDDEIKNKIAHRLELTAYEVPKTIDLLQNTDISYYIYQARERADEFINDNNIKE